MVEIKVRFQAGDCLHAWLRPTSTRRSALLTVTIGDVTHDLATEGPTRNPLPVAWQCPLSGDARIRWAEEATDLSLAYTFSPATVLDAGIRVLWTSEANRIDGERYRFHVGPPFGWMNDPNGLCEVDGLTHLYYQHNPHDRRWDTMHWGHAVSRDGIRWVHQPIAVFPEEGRVRGPGRQGGIYSGSARPQHDGSLRLFYTERDDDRRPAQERQMTVVLTDGRPAGRSTVILDAHPPVPGFRNDWRDPFVFEGPDGRLKMLLGGAGATGSLVLLYETENPGGSDGWQFSGILFREPSQRVVPAECPCMIRLDGEDLWLLVFGLIGSRDEATRRRNLTRAHVGRFDGRTFVPLYQHELDFGTDCYAMQVWRGSDGPRGVAWAANWTDVSADRDFESAMTLPRRILWRDAHLLTPPIAAVETLRAGPATTIARGDWTALGAGLAEIILDAPRRSAFAIAFAHPTHEMALTYDGHTLEFHYEPPGNRTVPSYRASCAGLRTLRIFIDVGLIEIYADEGRICCTKRIDSGLKVEALRWTSDEPEGSASMWRLVIEQKTRRRS